MYMIFFYVGTFGGLPPPHTRKLATLLLPAFAHQKSGQMKMADSVVPPPPHSLHEIAATAYMNICKNVCLLDVCSFFIFRLENVQSGAYLRRKFRLDDMYYIGKRVTIQTTGKSVFFHEHGNIIMKICTPK